jgi:inorganic phosphate transporter, PiT family
MARPALDKDLKRIDRLQASVREMGRGMVPVSLAGLFLLLVGLSTAGVVGLGGGWLVLVGSAMVGGYMALNIGANDVANNMAPAVGSRALKIVVAIAIAAVFEAAGALIAGGDVIATVSSGIIHPTAMGSPGQFTVAMIAALFAAALWINLATWVGAPVSTTHSVVGGVLGGGLAMAGFGAVDWSVVGRIVASWIVSPLLGGVIAAAFLAYIKFTILYVPDKLEQSERRVPLLVGIMAGAFSAYLLIKGLSRITAVPLWLALGVGLLVFLATTYSVRPYIRRQVKTLPQRRSSVGELFTIPVICGAALLSFAHGANDVANAIGPLAAIYTTVTEQALVAQAQIPLWILLIGAVGISLGLALYGPKLIRTVGSKITKLNRVRAFCVTVSAAITVIVASALGLPVSSTHIAIGALFGVGFLREFLEHRRRDGLAASGDADEPAGEPFGEPFGEPLGEPFNDRMRPGDAIYSLRSDAPENADRTAPLTLEQRRAQEAKRQGKLRRRYLVRRTHVVTIVSAWLITVPMSATIAAVLALVLNMIGLPGVP